MLKLKRFYTFRASSQLVLNLAFAPSWVLMGHLLKLKYAIETLECAYFSFNKCPIYTNDMQRLNLALIEN